MASTIKLKNGSGAPTSGQLVQGEPALDLTNKRLYTENASGTVIEVGINPSSLTTASADINGGTIDGTVIGGSSAAAGSFTTISASGEIAANGGIALGDNDKATFGASDDLQIYHNGSGSYIDDVGTGNLFVRADNLQLRRADGSQIYLAANTGAEVALYHAGNSKLATTATGINVTGTVTADGLTVESGGSISTSGGTTVSYRLDANRGTDDTSQGVRFGYAGIDAYRTSVALAFSQTAINFTQTGSDGTRKLGGFTSGGDFQLYEDTGTTAKLTWDASAESLGIGTTSPSAQLHSSIGSAGAGTLAQAMFGYAGGSTHYLDANNIIFRNGSATERARIDSSGNLLVGTTSTDYNSFTGIRCEASGAFRATTSGGPAGLFNRRDSDGDIITLRKDGTTVGSIGNLDANTIYIQGGNTFWGATLTSPQSGGSGVRLIDNGSTTRKFSSSLNGVHDLGSSAERFKNLYLSGGVYLGGTGAANHLDDYETGTFTATLRGSTAEPATLLTANGSYVKTGDHVFIKVAFETVNNTGYSGQVSISGLPFANSGARAMITVIGFNGATWTDSPTGSLASSDTTVVWQDAKSNASWSAVNHNTSASSFFWMTGSYSST